MPLFVRGRRALGLNQNRYRAAVVTRHGAHAPGDVADAHHFAHERTGARGMARQGRGDRVDRIDQFEKALLGGLPDVGGPQRLRPVWCSPSRARKRCHRLSRARAEIRQRLSLLPSGSRLTRLSMACTETLERECNPTNQRR